MDIFLMILLALVFLKAVSFGSDFSIFRLIKYGRLYWEWYETRPTFNQYINKLKVEKQQRRNKS